MSVSHIMCLAHNFKLRENQTKLLESMLPRGGDCRECGEYILWGDIIRGCYRRSAGGVIVDEEDTEEENTDEGTHEGTSSDADTFEATPIVLPVNKRSKATSKQKGKEPLRGTPSKKDGTRVTRKSRKTQLKDVLQTGEFFDLDDISSGPSDSLQAAHVATAESFSTSNRKRKTPAEIEAPSPKRNTTTDSTPETPLVRRRGRPRKTPSGRTYMTSANSPGNTEHSGPDDKIQKIKQSGNSRSFNSQSKNQREFSSSPPAYSSSSEELSMADLLRPPRMKQQQESSKHQDVAFSDTEMDASLPQVQGAGTERPKPNSNNSRSLFLSDEDLDPSFIESNDRSPIPSLHRHESPRLIRALSVLSVSSPPGSPGLVPTHDANEVEDIIELSD
jgi:hypothetical protein